MLRKLRIVIGILVFCSLSLFFFNVIDSLGILAKIQLIPALLAANLLSILFLSIMTLLLGRLYCSILCPLGIMQDIVIWVSRKASKNKKRFTYDPAWTKLRYAVLAIVVVAFFAGFALIPAILDPYSIYGRIATHLLSPVWLSINNLLAIVSDKFELYYIAKKTIHVQSIEAMLLSIGFLLVIGFMAWKYGRLYCNTICPAGTLLGTLSRFSLFKISINPVKCNHCSLCAATCKSSCIDSKTQRIDYSRCIDCFDCLENCPQNALTFTTRFSTKPSGKNADVTDIKVINMKAADTEVSRRRFLTTGALSMFGVAVSVAGATASPSAGSAGENQPVLPPGAKSNKHLSSNCTSCHLCVSKCPNQALKPMSIGYGIGAVMQPAMDYRKGYCDYECNLCGMTCPTDAIQQISLEQKQKIKIGYVVFNQTHCVVETDNVNCGNCAVHCPTKAITMVTYKDKKIPSIDLSRCIGCGSCEYHCPTNPRAIHVVGFAEHK